MQVWGGGDLEQTFASLALGTGQHTDTYQALAGHVDIGRPLP